ncbi:MAG: transporter substrate-binding domain-containing protein [Coriobacteriales bacterium]|jgi:ABC-type amino acid transport substrate-binding protein|nr:transporter substrate-binding domain-containing protein [Coriobacteriales bacterium]
MLRVKKGLALLMVLVLAMSLSLFGCGTSAPSGSDEPSTTDDQPVAAKTELVEFPATSEALAALEAGNVEAVVFDEPVAVEQVANTYTDAEIIEVIPTGEQYGFAVSKDNPELTAAVNWALGDIEKDGSFAPIFEKYFPGVSVPKLTTSATPASKPDLTAIKTVTAGTLTVGSDCDYPPFIYMEGETPAGFEYEILQLVGEKLGLKIEYLAPQAFDSILASVSAGTKMDIGVSSFTINDVRLETVDFCVPYFDSNQAVVALKSKGYTSVEDLRGKKVAAQSGTTGADWVRENLM